MNASSPTSTVTFSHEPICDKIAFRLEARWHRVCVRCGAGGRYHAHHVVDKQTLKGLGLRGNQLYDTRNAMRLCDSLDGERCHMNFEWGNGRLKIATVKLSGENLDYAFEKLGAYAYDYLRREYDDSVPDPRLTARLALAA